MDAAQRRSFYADRVQAGGRWFDTSTAEFTGPDARPPDPGPQAWHIDLLSPFVRYQYVDQAMGFRAAKWRLGLTGWRIEEHFFYG